jgi:hypothetical protein
MVCGTVIALVGDFVISTFRLGVESKVNGQGEQKQKMAMGAEKKKIWYTDMDIITTYDYIIEKDWYHFIVHQKVSIVIVSDMHAALGSYSLSAWLYWLLWSSCELPYRRQTLWRLNMTGSGSGERTSAYIDAALP